jgi:hypothetical protein
MKNYLIGSSTQKKTPGNTGLDKVLWDVICDVADGYKFGAGM